MKRGDIINQPRNTQQMHAFAIDGQIDRLVDGELPDADRRALIQRFETEPDGWRRCALAFLEAQSWREALIPATTAEPNLPPARVIPSRRTSYRWREAARLTALAASLLLTFALGWILHRTPGTTSPEGAIAHLDRQPPQEAIEQRPPEASHPLKHDALSAPATSQFAEMNSAVKDWDRRGYQAETQTRLATVKLKDGRKVEIPVQEVRLRFVGNRTY
ncbi:MAG TPA: hypothetical protein VGP68_07770 [Gemmataceae bacterium]|jgi:anti-sigma factor RsiW|nr:hypothetical protein [Gemmataceae bacterium]